MVVGTVREIKIGENRVGLTPYGADALVGAGHTVLVQKGAGVNSGFPDADYRQVGAQIVGQARTVYKRAEMIIKVKEPQKSEFGYYHPGLILYTYLHLAAEPEVTKMLLAKKVTGVAYETVELDDGRLPLLAPMSEVAGRMAVHIGGWFLQKYNGGLGRLLGGVPGVYPAKVVILGGTGVVGKNATKMAVGLGAEVVVFGRNPYKLREIDDLYRGRVKTAIAHPLAIEEALQEADLVVSGVLIPGAEAPKLITRRMVKRMKKGAVIVDVSIDQGGTAETSRPTSHADPVYEVDGVVHYCVTNMPGAVPHTSTMALTNATIKYALDIANKGIEKAVQDDSALAKGVNTYDGECTYKAISEASGLKYTSLSDIM